MRFSGPAPPAVKVWANTEMTSRLPCPLLLLKERSWPVTVTVSPGDTGSDASRDWGAMICSLSGWPDRRRTDSGKR